MKTHRAAVLDDGVPEAGVALRSQLLTVGPSEDQGLRQAAALLVFVSHAVPAVVRDALVRLCGQELQQLQLNRRGVRLLLLTSVAELKPDVDLTALHPTSRHSSLQNPAVDFLPWFHCSCQLQTRPVFRRWDWILSTSFSWECWLDWQRCRFHHFPYYRRP